VPSTTVTATHLDTRHLNATDDVVALGAGTAAIGKLSANPGVDIGDVDVASILPGTAAANLGKAEDAVHSSGDVGVMALAVSKATPELLGAAGDYVPLETDADGRLWVNAVPGTIWTVFHNEPSALANTDTSLAAAPGAGLSLYVTDWIVTNGSTAAITIFLEEDTASTKSPKTATHQVPKDGGFAMKYTTPIKLTANKDLGFTVVNASIYGVEVHGYTAP
jgi:hypothetical protein